MDMKFLRCAHCGKIIAVVKETGVPVICCGEKMAEIIPGVADASKEKHVPVVKTEGNIVKVTVGAENHPMTEEHYIEWIALKTQHGNQRKMLEPGNAPEAEFAMLDGDSVKEVFAFCNLHGLWKA